MYKLIHLHTDFKFLHDTLRYEDSLLHNEIIFIGDCDETIMERMKILSLKCYTFNSSEIEKILEIISFSDGVVFYGLDKLKIQILEKINEDKKVFLRLFGYELYSLKRDKFSSKTSLDLSIPISLKNYSLQEYLKRKIKRKLGIEFKVDIEKQKNIYSKIDAILLLNEFEYADLSKYFYLPKFIKLSFLREAPTTLELSNKKNEIIVGNSRNSWNNHLDVFKIIKKSKKAKNFNFVLFFNYGSNNMYADAVRKKTKSNIVFIEDFLDKKEFDAIYDTVAALVINSYRQHALGNIFTAILAGARVYLNQKSSTYKWLKHEGFVISEINELPNEIDNNKIRLTQSEYQQNINCFNKLKHNYTTANFLENIISILKNE